MLPYRAKGLVDMISQGFLDGEVVLDYPGGPYVITKVLTRGRQEGQSQEKG